MREYGQIQSTYWTHAVQKEWCNEAIILGGYLLAGEHTSSIGCMRVPKGYVMADFNWSDQTVSKAFQELFEDGFIQVDFQTGWVVIPKFLFWNPIANPNVAKKIEKEFRTIPKNISVYKYLVDSLNRYGNHFSDDFKNHLETLCQTLSKQDPTLPDPEKTRPFSISGEQTVSGFVPSQEVCSKGDQAKQESDPESFRLVNAISDDSDSQQTKTKKLKQDAIEILEFLNEKTGRNFQAVETNLKPIINRIKEGATPQQCRQIIVRKCRAWLTDENMQEYLRPVTLFNATKFWTYHGELVPPKQEASHG